MIFNTRLFLTGLTLGTLSATAWSATDGNPDELAQVDAGTLEQVVVTARKREERLLDVPLSLSAVQGRQLEDVGLKSIDRISVLDPSVMYDANGTGQGGTPSIRGSSTRSTGQTETPIGLFQDGIYDSRPASINRQPIDVARVEVLKGPQGTLFGRNTIAGAISITTNDPTEIFEGNVQAEYGGSSTHGDTLWAATGVISGPLTDNLSGRIVVHNAEREGYLEDPVSGFRGGLYQVEVYRAKLMWRGEGFTVKLSGEHSFEDRPRVDCLLYGDGKRWTSNPTMPVSAFTYCGQPNLWEAVRSDFQASSKVGSDSVNLSVDFDTPIGTITSLSGFKSGDWQSHLNTDQAQYEAATSNSSDNHQLFSEELRVVGESGRWSWLGGLYYFQDESKNGGNSITGPYASAYATGQRESIDNNYQRLQSYAVFGQVSLDILQNLTLAVGGRYSNDDKQSRYESFNYTVSTTSSFSVLREGTWESFDPSASLTYHFTPDSMVYVSYGSGYRAGGFNDGATAVASGPAGYYEPEQVDSYEVGVKGRFFDGRLQGSLAAFLTDYTDLLINTSTRDEATNTIFTTQVNAGESQVTGIEMSAEYRIIDPITLTAAVAINEGEIDKFTPKVPGSADYTGFPLPRMSPLSYVVGLEYNSSIGLGNFFGRLSYRYRDTYTNTVNANIDPSTGEPANLWTPAYDVWDLNIGYSWSTWRINAYGRNLANEQYTPSLIASLANRFPVAMPSERRTVGVQVRVSF